MKKYTRIFAFIAALLLAGLYVSTLVFSLMSHPMAANLLKGAVAATILIPVILYGCILVYRLAHPHDEDENNDRKN